MSTTTTAIPGLLSPSFSHRLRSPRQHGPRRVVLRACAATKAVHPRSVVPQSRAQSRLQHRFTPRTPSHPSLTPRLRTRPTQAASAPPRTLRLPSLWANRSHARLRSPTRAVSHRPRLTRSSATRAPCAGFWLSCCAARVLRHQLYSLPCTTFPKLALPSVRSSTKSSNQELPEMVPAKMTNSRVATRIPRCWTRAASCSPPSC